MCERERRPNLCVIDGEPAKETVLLSEGASGAVSTGHLHVQAASQPLSRWQAGLACPGRPWWRGVVTA